MIAFHDLKGRRRKDLSWHFCHSQSIPSSSSSPFTVSEHNTDTAAGIHVGGSKVVHFTRKKDASFGSSSAASAICPTFPDCGFRQPDSGVILCCLDCFLGNGALYRFEYGVSPSVFLAKLRGGTCTTAESDPPDSVIDRAMHLLHNGFGSYDVFENNCEDFALYCKTGLLLLEEPGVGRSGQASSFLGVPLAALFSTPFKLLAAGPVGMAAVTAGAYCAGRYITDIGVRKDVMKVAVEDLAATMGCRSSNERLVGNVSGGSGNVPSIEEEERGR
ncbi:hypothetical protein C4D60_Mb01t13160 [Musa balbisiana]|uniref:LRAT domain-containing protein n=1 Tax=Musa balbisiana TaxID=52838 RepID=A0A4S8JMT1_MUSBA|nr:hypothetical protein C4D60_Mb01t13160 [Musa balbisiana]